MDVFGAPCIFGARVATQPASLEFDLIDFCRNETQLFGADSAKLGVAGQTHV
jgi:hypothetical protein